VLFGRHGTIEVQSGARESASPPVNLYIVEFWVLFVGHRTIDAQF
jgi:hypothetical protein